MLLPTVFLPEIYVNRLLSSQKAQEHHDIRGRLESLAELPADRKPDDVMERLLLHHHLTGQLQQLQTISPSLMDIRFFVQIRASVTAIFLANLLLRALVN